MVTYITCTALTGLGYVCPTIPKCCPVCWRVCHPPSEVQPPPSPGAAVINVNEDPPVPTPVATTEPGADVAITGPSADSNVDNNITNSAPVLLQEIIIDAQILHLNQ